MMNSAPRLRKTTSPGETKAVLPARVRKLSDRARGARGSDRLCRARAAPEGAPPGRRARRSPAAVAADAAMAVAASAAVAAGAAMAVAADAAMAVAAGAAMAAAAVDAAHPAPDHG